MHAHGGSSGRAAQRHLPPAGSARRAVDLSAGAAGPHPPAPAGDVHDCAQMERLLHAPVSPASRRVRTAPLQPSPSSARALKQIITPTPFRPMVGPTVTTVRPTPLSE
jgi:hypothetical protein